MCDDKIDLYKSIKKEFLKMIERTNFSGHEIQ